jgi:probable HAF family extracellular repeat protein
MCPSAGTTHAFVTDATNHSLTDLGNLGGDSSHGYAINTSGQVTGASDVVGRAVTHGFLWTQGRLKDLNELLPASQSAQFEVIAGRASTMRERFRPMQPCEPPVNPWC